MRTIRRAGISLVLAANAALSACSGASRAPAGCFANEECGAGGRCTARICVADGAPVAAIARPEALTVFGLFTFDGSASADPDPQDAIRAHRWTFSAADAPCAPPTVADTGPLANVRFACAGRYTVQLVVEDELGVASVPAVETFEVTDSGELSKLTVGPDLVVGHVCAAGRCAPDGVVALTATATGGAATAVAYRWTVTPPSNRPLDGTRRVSFAPSAAVPEPIVTIETDDAAISGDWLFQVEARDAAGVLGTAVTRVSVTNRPPLVTAIAPGPAPHRFDAATSVFTASGAVASVSVIDPDGDPIPSRAVAWLHANDGGHVFEGVDSGSSVSFRIAVPHTTIGDERFLIGGAGLERAIRLTASDVNGDEAVASWPVVVGNRPPVLAAPAPAPLHVSHVYDPSQGLYKATAMLGRWSDPDGDPLMGGPTGDAGCGALDVLPDGTTVLLCSRPYTGIPQVHLFAGDHPVSETVRDPWAASSAPVTVTIDDRAPIVTNTSGVTQVACTKSSYCCAAAGTCILYAENYPSTSFPLTPAVTDLDGDPVSVSFSGSTVSSSTTIVCANGWCPSVWMKTLGGAECYQPPTTEITINASDGALTATGKHFQTPSCP